jgi:3-phenylpropionate/trans-cinnamate dioxygenase ferredoxin reductase subunit
MHPTSGPPTDRGVVIAGGGLAAQRAVETLRRNGFVHAIRVITAEPTAPYDRPPLSKGYLAGAVGDDALRFRPDAWYREQDVDLITSAPAAALDVARREVTLASGERLRFGHLLIATGGVPRALPGTESFDNVHVLRTVEDARRLRDALTPGSRLTVIGAGFIGMEVAATAARLGVDVTIIEAAQAPLAGILGPGLGGWFAELHRQEGIAVNVGARITGLRGAHSIEAIELEDGRRVECDAVVVGIGMAPATSWLRDSGLDEGGIPVDAAGRTRIPGIYAAGDACRPHDSRTGRLLRSEHWEAAARQGAAAARAILGLTPAPPAIPSFWSDQHDLRIQYVGHAHGSDAIAIDGDPDARDFTATYTRGGVPVAALLVGRPHALAQTRRLIEDHHPKERTAACPSSRTSTSSPAPRTATAPWSRPTSSPWRT